MNLCTVIDKTVQELMLHVKSMVVSLMMASAKHFGVELSDIGYLLISPAPLTNKLFVFF